VVGETFSFRHALLRDAGYASLARVERARLHVRMARWLEGAAGRHAGQVAGVIGRHYAAAVDAAPTLSADVGDGTARDEATSLASLWFERGAEAAMALAAHDAAAALFRRALELTADDDVLARARRLAGLARATAFVSDMDEGTRLARDALALLREVVAGGRATAEVRVAYAATTWLLCRILAQQLRFHEVVELAERGLADIGEADDVPTGRLVVARGLGRSMIGDEELASNERGSLERVLAIAWSAADRDLELDARMWLSLEDGDESHWRRIAEVAGELGRLDAAAQALQVLTALTLPDDAASGLTRLQEQRPFGVAHGLTEETAWADYRESELRFHLGGWDEAFAAATRAIEVGIEHAFHRVTVRSWHVATMIADGRGDADTLTRAADWYRARRVELPDSPYGRLSLKQVELIFARNGIVEFDPPDLEHLAASLIEEHVLPSWFAGVDLVVSSWIDRGDLEAARSAVSAFVGAGRPSRGVFGGAVADLLGARISNARAEAERAAEAFRALGTPWWLAKALRLLDRADRPTAAERREAEAIERRLGLVAPAR
jgi:tetratricopeptide (TPR) repeat protein